MAASVRPDLRPPRADIHFLVERALAEDLTPLGDLSSALLPAGVEATATFATREAGVIAGCACVEETMAAVDPSLTVAWNRTDGDPVVAGDVVGTVTGPFASLLTAERTALNFLGALSGIATAAARWVEVAAGRVVVWDTRKTTPGYRSLQKAAVRAGGAANHRGNLAEWIMLKDNHLCGLTVAEGVARARTMWPGRTVQVEADTVELLDAALEAGADLVLLDNFEPADLVDLVARVDGWADRTGRRRPLLEASGGITLATLDAYAATGVDLVSSGSLTNAAGVLDIGLDIVPG